MSEDYSLDEGQTKAEPRRAAAFNARLKDILHNIRGKAGTIIFDGKNCGGFLCGERDCDSSRGGKVLEFVVEKIGDGAVEESGISLDGDWNEDAQFEV